MEIVTCASTIAGIPFRLKEIVNVITDECGCIQRIKDNPKQKAEPDERINTLHDKVQPLRTDSDDAAYSLVLEDLQSLDKLLGSLPKPRAPMALLKSKQYGKKLQEARLKLDELLTKCAQLHIRDQLTSMRYHRERNLPTCKAGLGRSDHVLTFLEKQNAPKQPRRVIVIYGPTGIGKTTLLETIWQKALSRVLPFHAYAYVQLGEGLKLEDITKTQSAVCQQLCEKKEKFPAFSFGQNALAELLIKLKDQEKPVFLAIDNIFEVEHLTRILPSQLGVEDMPSSSCIAVTCRDQKIGNALLGICCLKAKDFSQRLFFQPLYLNSEESKELFAESAGMKLSDPGCERLLEILAPLGGGLPLALKVLGSMCKDEKRREEEWAHIRRQWTTFDDSGDPHTSKVTTAMHVSYKLLHESCQWAFLDVVVTSFYGWPWVLWKGIVGKEKMKDLKESSLISKVDSQILCNQSSLRRRSHGLVTMFTEIGCVWIAGFCVGARCNLAIWGEHQ